jgi:transketolase
MRATFIKTLLELAEQDERILLLTADLGYTVVEAFAQRFPDRFYNVGVAEQNMVGVATGLAEAGFLPFVYSIATFATMRPYEFIRNGPVLHRLPVRIVGVGGGFEYGTAGPTHHALEDVGILRIQPDLTIVAPADFMQTRTALRTTWDAPGPVYYRLGKDEKTTVPGLDGAFALGRAQTIREGDEIQVIAMGSVAAEAAAAVVLLLGEGISAGFTIVASVAPSPTEDLARVLSRTPVAITVEAHYAVGGVGSLVSEVVAGRGLGTRIVRCAVGAHASRRSGGEPYLLRSHGLDRQGVLDAAIQALRTIPRTVDS